MARQVIMSTSFKQMFDYSRVGFLTVVLAITSCKKPPAEQPRPPAMVTVADVQVQDVPIYLDEIGSVAATESVTLRSQVAGKVTAVNFVEGSDVKKGQVLYEIDPRPFRAALAQSEAAVAQAMATRDTAKADFERMDAVRSTAAISQADYDAKKGALAVAEAQILAAQANVETARLNLDYCTIKSPIDGRTGQRLVDAGNLVKENDTDLVRIQQLDPIFVDFTITEGELPTVKQYLDRSQLKVQVWLPSEIERSLAGGTTQPSTSPTTLPEGGTPFTRPTRLGNLVFIDNAVREGTGTVKVRASVPNADRSLWPGQYVRVRTILTVKKDAVLVPTESIQVGQTGPFIYVVEHDVAMLRPITLGQRHEGKTVVLTGLQAGDKVVHTGQMMLMPGAKVMVTNAPATQPAVAQENKPGVTS
jgi:multidrug efflux system membrane fusion protein